EDALREPAVRELEARDDVAHGVDVADARVEPIVRRDEAAGERDAPLLVAEGRGARATAEPDGPGGGGEGGAVPAREVHARVVRRHALEAHAGVEGDAALAVGALESLRERGVLVRQQVREGLDDRDLGTEGAPHARELGTDHTATEHDGRTGDP